MVSNGIITAPVDLVGDVAKILNQATYDVAYLCSNQHGQINPWAKYKPEIINQVGIIKLNQRADNNFGLTPAASWTDITTLVTSVKNGDFATKCRWSYNPPVPGTDWCRLTDFISEGGTTGYNHNATSPFGTLVSMTLPINGTTVTIPLDAPDLDDDGSSTSVRLGDFNGSLYALKKYYFGILLYKNASSSYFAATTTIPMEDAEDWQVDITGFTGSAGTWYAYPFLSSIPFTTTSEATSLKLVGIHNPGVTMTLTSLSTIYFATFYAYYESGASTSVAYHIEIENTSTSATSMPVKLELATNDSGSNAVTAYNNSGDNISIAAKSTWSTDGTYATRYIRGFYQFCRLTYGVSGGITTGWMPIDLADDDSDV